MLTTIHVVSSENTVVRERKRPRLTSTNGRQVRAVFGDNPTKQLAISQIVDDYNFRMGGVDIADQLRAAYTCHHASRRTWMSLFFWLIDTCATNSYCIYRCLFPEWKNRHKEFRKNLARQLISDGEVGMQILTMGESCVFGSCGRACPCEKGTCRWICQRGMFRGTAIFSSRPTSFTATG